MHLVFLVEHFVELLCVVHLVLAGGGEELHHGRPSSLAALCNSCEVVEVAVVCDGGVRWLTVDVVHGRRSNVVELVGVMLIGSPGRLPEHEVLILHCWNCLSFVSV